VSTAGVLDLFRLTGRTVCVTRASSGLGAAIAAAYAEVGADVVLAARRVGRLEEMAEAVRAAGRQVEGAYWCAQECGRIMRPGSSIINVASILGITTAGLPQAAYAASKAGLIGLTRDLAQQWGPRNGIRVNAVAPGFFRTEMTSEYREGYLEQMAPRMLQGRTGGIEELAATIVWLASPAGGYVTGQTVIVDGGVTIT
jgi:NAD(P)-dependent dehydrogenase (short-subunit alcohol dehydrogenase family)